MKKYILTILISISIINLGFTQISYEGEYDANSKIFILPDGNLKFYRMDEKTKSLLIFNADQSLWKTVKIALPNDHYINDVNIIKSSKSSGDYHMTILYTCYYLSNNYAIEDVSEYFSKEIFSLNVIDENGNFLLQVPEAREYKLLSNEGNSKLLVYKTANKGFKSKKLLEVYAINSK